MDRPAARLDRDQRQRARDSVLSVGVRTFPYLADHGFQDMVVVPGSFYVDLGLSAHRERFGRASVTDAQRRISEPHHPRQR